MYHLDNGQKATNPKPSSQAFRESGTAWQFIRILANVPLSTRELRSRPLKKLDFVILFHTKLLTSIAYKLNSYWATSCTERHRFDCSNPFQPVCLKTGKSGGFG